VRDCFSVAPRALTRLLAARYRVLDEPDDSRNATQQVYGGPKIPTAFDHAFGLHDSYVLHHLIRRPVLRSGNSNPTHNRRVDVDDEIYILRNFGSVSVAKEYVQAPLPFFAAVERDSQQSVLTINMSSGKSFRMPLTSILSPKAGRGGERSRAKVSLF